MDDVKPLLIDVPDQIKTDRLLLRVPRAGDGAIVFPSVRESLAELKPWMPWAKDDYAQNDAEQWCRKSSAGFIERSEIQLLIFDGRDEQHLGNVGVFRFDWAVPRGEIGYWLRTTRTGKGLMCEAVNGLSGMLMEHLKFHRVEIRMDDRNDRSWRVAERCGYRLDGVLRNDGRAPDGALRHTRVYSKIPADA
jgi:RimJ/RimL family protein N-acetyltransferase